MAVPAFIRSSARESDVIAALGDGLSSSEDEDSAWLPPSGVVSAAESDPELTATLAQAAMSIGLKVSSPPNPECSWLDDWILDAALSQRCMKRSQSHGRPLLQPEATHCPPLSSLPLMWCRTLTFPRWREQLRCTCARKTPPPVGTVHASHPKPVS